MWDVVFTQGDQNLESAEHMVALELNFQVVGAGAVHQNGKIDD
jgi:hypothetical protein